MIAIKEKADCCGCGACRDVCPTQAIRLITDEEGFLYPVADADQCIGCGKCDRTCPVSSPKEEKREIAAYAAQTKDETVCKSSSSGGLFTEIASYILERGGIVFGAAFDETFKVVHIGVERAEELEKLRGSKYVQSEIGDAYIRAKEQLNSGRLVLFTGTPCQISGLYAFLGREYSTLYTQDIICHGVPSPMVWKKYVDYREAMSGAKLKRAFFRDKEHGWRNYSMRFEFKNGKEHTSVFSNDLYMRGFLSNLCLRPSCYRCAFKTKSRPADFTLADFWGAEKLLPEVDDRGTSLVILHSARARSLFESIKPNLNCCETDFEEAIKYNSAMVRSCPMNENRSAYMGAVLKNGFRGGKKYLKKTLVRRLKDVARAMITKITGR